MTPEEILDTAKTQFPVLYIDDEAGTFVASLLVKSLGKYQDKAGCLLSLAVSYTHLTLPTN